MRIKRSWMSVALLVPTMAFAQYDFGGGATSNAKPWESFKLNPKSRIKLDYRNSNIDLILEMFQRATGITIVKDPSLTGGLTVQSAKAVSLNEAFQILSTTLSLKGYDLQKEDNLLVIRQKNKGGNDRGGGLFGSSGFPMPDFGSQSQPQLKVYPIQFANASQVARVLNDVFQPTGGATNPFQNLFNRGGFGGGQGGFNRGGAGGRFGGNGGNPFAGGFNFGALGSQQNPVRASADDFSNSVIVNAGDREQNQVRDLIKQLDHPSDEPQQSRVFKLQFASSDDLVPTIQNLLQANVPRGRGGATTQSNQGPQAFINALRGNTPGSGTVTSDPRTNSIVVTATKENLDIVARVVKELDTEVTLQSSTFVFPLSNARADNVANLLNQAFGQRQGTGNTFNNANRTNNNNTNRTNNNNLNRNNNNRGLGGSTGNGEELAENTIPITLRDPNSDSGELQTNIAVAQGFGGGGFGGQQRRPNTGGANGTQVSRDASGRVVNSVDLTGQVTVIADPNTNSVIVVTTPGNADIIRNILDQLDRIPEQVMIETIIVEATLNRSDQFGVEWKLANSNILGNSGTTSTGTQDFGQQTNPPPQGFRYTLTSGNLTAFLNAMQQDQKFQVLSTPRIFTSNGVQAQINISQSVPYITSSREDANGNFTYNYSFQPVGIVLTVTPRITSNGYVTMEVTQTANDLQGYTSFNAPIINQREADTTVSVKDGETVILGGIIRSNVTSTVKKIPLLGDLPILGNIFKSTSKANEKTELLVFLSPKVVRDPAEAKRLREQTNKELSPDTQRRINSVINGGPTAPGDPTQPDKKGTTDPKKSGG